MGKARTICFVAASLLALPPAAEAQSTTISEKRICTLSGQPVDGAVALSPDRRHFLTVEKEGQMQRAVLDGRQEPPYDEVRTYTLMFSPDGSRHAYVARSAQRWFVVVDGKEMNAYRGVEYSNLLFSPDSRRVGFIANADDEGRARVVVDGRDGPVQDSLSDLAFSADGRHFAYVRHLRGFSLQDARAVEDNVERPEGEVRIVYSPDPTSPAVILTHRAKLALRFRGTTSPDVDDIDVHSIRFSPDGKRVAFWAASGGQWRVIVDSKEQKPQPRKMFPMQPGDQEPITWSPDSKHVAYPISGSVVLDGVEQKRYDFVSFFTVSFSPNGERLAFVATKDRDEFAVVDGVEGKKYPTVYRPVFSPDSKRVAYLMRSEQPGDPWQAVVDGREGRVYDDMGGRIRLFQDICGQFSPDGRHFLYKGKRGGKWHVVVDAQESPAYDEFPMDDPIIVDSPTTFHLIARRGADYFVLEGRFASDNRGR